MIVKIKSPRNVVFICGCWMVVCTHERVFNFVLTWLVMFTLSRLDKFHVLSILFSINFRQETILKLFLKKIINFLRNIKVCWKQNWIVKSFFVVSLGHRNIQIKCVLASQSPIVKFLVGRRLKKNENDASYKRSSVN